MQKKDITFVQIKRNDNVVLFFFNWYKFLKSKTTKGNKIGWPFQWVIKQNIHMNVNSLVTIWGVERNGWWDKENVQIECESNRVGSSIFCNCEWLY